MNDSKHEDFFVLVGLISNVSHSVHAPIEPVLGEMFAVFVTWADEEPSKTVASIGDLKQYLTTTAQFLAEKHALSPEAIHPLLEFADDFFVAFLPTEEEHHELERLAQRWCSHLPQHQAIAVPQQGPVIDINYMVTQVWRNGRRRHKETLRAHMPAHAWGEADPDKLYADHLAKLTDENRRTEWLDCVANLPPTSARKAFISEPEFWQRLEQLVSRHGAIAL